MLTKRRRRMFYWGLMICLLCSKQRRQAEMHSVKKTQERSITFSCSRDFNIISRCCVNIYLYMQGTWKRTKCIRNSMRRGRPNQNKSSPGWTTGAPFTTSPLSWILNPIFVMITCSFVPTVRIIWNIWIKPQETPLVNQIFFK